MSELVVDKVIQIRLCNKCSACGKEFDLVETGRRVFENPHYCPHCGFDLLAERQAEQEKRRLAIENNPNCQIRYDVIEAYECGVKRHPQEQMRFLGYQLIDSIPQSIADCWWFTVDKFIEPLPTYLHKMRYNIGEP